MWKWQGRFRRKGRPMKPRLITYLSPSTVSSNITYGLRHPPTSEEEPIMMSIDEYEAYILIYFEGLTQEEAARRMGVSRGTLWRSLNSARKKIAGMLATKKPLIVQ